MKAQALVMFDEIEPIEKYVYCYIPCGVYVGTISAKPHLDVNLTSGSLTDTQRRSARGF